MTLKEKTEQRYLELSMIMNYMMQQIKINSEAGNISAVIDYSEGLKEYRNEYEAIRKELGNEDLPF